MTWQDSINAPVNAQGEYAAKKFYGDPKLAAAYLPVAYALLGGVKNQMALSGVGFGHRMIELPDGTRIRVIRNGNQNLVEIDASIPTQRREQEEVLRGFVFYPRTDSGASSLTYFSIYPDTPPVNAFDVYDLRYADSCFSYLGYKNRGGNSEIKLSYSATPAKKALYGNQFFFDGADVYSWWHSSCGDGPVIGEFAYGVPDYKENVAEYAVYFHDRKFKFSSNNTVFEIKPVVFKNSSVFYNLQEGSHVIISGFYQYYHKNKDGVSERRCIIAKTYLYPSIYTTLTAYAVFFIDNKYSFSQKSSVFTIFPIDETYEYYNYEYMQYSKSNHALWPVRFNNTGTSAAMLFAGSKNGKYNKGEVDIINRADISIINTDEGVLFSSEIALGEQQMVVYTTAVNSSESAPYLTRDYEKPYTFSGTFTETTSVDCKFPIGLNYVGDTLVVASAYIDNTGQVVANSDVSMYQRHYSTSTFTGSSDGKTAREEGSLYHDEKQLHSNSRTIKSGGSISFLIGDREFKTIDRTITNFYEGANFSLTRQASMSWSYKYTYDSFTGQYSYVSGGTKGNNGSASVHSESYRDEYYNTTGGYLFKVFYVNVKRNIVFYAYPSYEKKVSRRFAISDYGNGWNYPVSSIPWINPNQQVSGTIQSSVTLDLYAKCFVGDTVVLDYAPRKEFSSDIIQAGPNDYFQVFDVIWDPKGVNNYTTTYSVPINLYGVFNIFSHVYTTTDPSNISYSMVCDERNDIFGIDKDIALWALSFSVDIKPDNQGYETYKTNQAFFGDINQHIFNVDENGAIIKTPVQDDRLVVFPIGMY